MTVGGSPSISNSDPRQNQDICSTETGDYSQTASHMLNTTNDGHSPDSECSTSSVVISTDYGGQSYDMSDDSLNTTNKDSDGHIDHSEIVPTNNVTGIVLSEQYDKTENDKSEMSSDMPAKSNSVIKNSMKVKGIKLMHLNVHHLLPKLATGEIKAELDSMDVVYHVLGFSETFLNSTIPDAEVELPGYVLHRKDRVGKTGGGLAVYVADHLVVVRRKDLEVDTMETLWLEVKPKGSKSFLVCNVYRPPNICLDQWMSSFETALEKVNVDENEIMIMGDLNVDLNVKNTKSNQLKDILDAYGLEQLITAPTRVTERSSTLIDHIYVSDPHKIVSSGVLELSLSDHFAVWAIHHNKCKLESQNKSHKIIEFRKMKNFELTKFATDLNQLPWNNVLLYDNPNEALDVWYQLFMHILDRHAPKVKKRVKTWQQPEWMTTEILEAIKVRQHYRKKKRFTEYKRQRQLVKQLVKKAKHEFYESLITTGKNKSAGIWKCIKSLNNKKSNTTPNTMHKGSNVLTNSKDIAENVNSLFINAGRASADSTYDANERVRKAAPSLNKLREFVAETSDTRELFHISPVTNDFVCKQLKSLNPNKAKGIDDIGPYFLKLAAEIISPSLCYILNRSICSGIFPDRWKMAKVTPLHKKDKKENIENYRPISILCTLSKILERHVHQEFYDYLTNANLLLPQQSGFRPQHSCVTALTHITDSWLSSINEGKMVGALFVDLQKAFDSIDHTILLEKLHTRYLWM